MEKFREQRYVMMEGWEGASQIAPVLTQGFHVQLDPSRQLQFVHLFVVMGFYRLMKNVTITLKGDAWVIALELVLIMNVTKAHPHNVNAWKDIYFKEFYAIQCVEMG